MLFLTITLTAYKLYGQGTLDVDQAFFSAMSAQPIQGYEPIGQSFTPSLSSVDFIGLALNDANPGNGLGATVTLDLRSGSITGPLLATTTPVTMPDGYTGNVPANPGSYGPIFFFPTPVTVTPGTTYYFDIDVLSGDTWIVGIGGGTYPGGHAYANGVASTAANLVFYEGVVVPEPSVAWLALAGGGVFLGFRCRRKSPES